MSRVTPASWSDKLVERIADQDFVLFIGAGVSTNSSNAHGERPPGWKSLVELLAAKFVNDHAATSRSVRAAVRSGDLLTAAETIEHYCRENSRLDDFRAEIARLTDGGSAIDRVFHRNQIHERISDLAPRIIITTNFDNILERHFLNGFKAFTYNQDGTDIASYVRQGDEVLIKLHGGVADPARMIITRMDFTKLRREGRTTLETVESLLMTRTALFIGYSLDDPDMRMLLETQFGAKGARPGHYLLASDKTPSLKRSLLKEAYGVNLVTYSGEHEEGVLRSLEELIERVEAEKSKKRLTF
jgi:hypothetical protein